jgi:phospholipid/cholesterol/gamma-HCH transport system permease protein
MSDEGWIETQQDGQTLTLRPVGRWLVTGSAALDRSVKGIDTKGFSKARIDFASLEALDTVGAWLVLRLKAALSKAGADVSFENLADHFDPLIKQVEKFQPEAPAAPEAPPSVVIETLAAVGAWTTEHLCELRDGLGFLGLVTVSAGKVIRNPKRLRFVAFVSQVQRTGPAALPIIGLLSFLIGVVIAYQGADQLRQFGAEIFTVNLLGVGFLRELGVLLTAIIVAGRSGSAFTAEIGTMQVNEEIDAMTTIGLDPVEVLVLPRLAALLVTLPLMTFYADMMGLLGGAVVCDLALGIPLPIFVQQLSQAIAGTPQFWLGLIKAPFFAMCIALVGCREGLRVERSAESVGRRTTLAVVESIFLVIVFDAAFSVIFAQFHI